MDPFAVFNERSIGTFLRFNKASEQFFRLFKQEKRLLTNLVLESFKRKELFALSEHYDILDKLVLFSCNKTNVRIRLHLFSEEYFDRPHNHRWSYSSQILYGEYRHTLFRLNGDPSEPKAEDLEPVLIRKEKKGDFYTLHWSQYHSIDAYPNTVTLVVRAPPVVDRFRVIDKVTDEAWWQYGAKQESQSDKEKKQMTSEHYNEIIKTLESLNLI